MEDFESKYNTKIPAVKRLMREACELRDATEEYSAHPLEDNLFEWHFTVRGSPGTEFEHGVYHGRIILPNQYPMKPPNIILLTPNGRFEVNKKICLSISGYHPETWQPSWSIRTALLALIAFMPTAHKGAIGSLDYTPEERRTLARKSQKWECPNCGPISKLLGANVLPISTAESQLIKSVVFKIIESVATMTKYAFCITPAESRWITNKTEEAPAAVKTEEQKKEDADKENSNDQNAVRDNQAEQNLIDSTTNINSTQSMADEEVSGFSINERTGNILIAVIVLAIALLLYRRLFLI